MLFFLGGLIFLSLGLLKIVDAGFFKAWEFLVLGAIMFIPGSYHTFIALMCWRRVPGYSYEDVAVFDEDLFDNDD